MKDAQKICVLKLNLEKETNKPKNGNFWEPELILIMHQNHQILFGKILK